MDMLVVTLGVVVVASVVVYLLFFRGGAGRGSKTRAPGNTILFLGNSGTGKTVLFSKLFRGTLPQTVNSIQEERLEGVRLFRQKGEEEVKPFNAVCLPGNLRLRGLYRKHLPVTAGIVLVIDAQDPDIKGTAALLHELLVDPVIDERCPDILIACSKNDVAKRDPDFTNFVMKSLEDELEIVKTSQNSVSTEGTTGDDVLSLGVKGQAFKFAEDSPSDVRCVLCSVAADGTARVEAVEDFIQSCFPRA